MIRHGRQTSLAWAGAYFYLQWISVLRETLANSTWKEEIGGRHCVIKDWTWPVLQSSVLGRMTALNMSYQRKCLEHVDMTYWWYVILTYLSISIPCSWPHGAWHDLGFGHPAERTRMVNVYHPVNSCVLYIMMYWLCIEINWSSKQFGTGFSLIGGWCLDPTWEVLVVVPSITSFGSGHL